MYLEYIASESNTHLIITVNMEKESKTLGRTELAQLYFPYILPHSAWKKFKSLLEEDPDLQRISQIKRRSYTPAEVNIIYQRLGHP